MSENPFDPNFELPGLPLQGASPVLVSYIGGTSGSSLATSYFEAAKRLALTFDSAGRNAGDDQFAYSFLFLIRHAVELALKDYLSELHNHKRLKCCRNLGSIDSAPLHEHKLLPIYDAICNAIIEDHLHSNYDEFKLARALVSKLDQEDFSSESLRYVRNKQGQLSLLFTKQKYIDVHKFMASCGSIIGYCRYASGNQALYYCSRKWFKKKYIDTIKKTLSLVERSKNIRDEYLEKYIPPVVLPGESLLKGAKIDKENKVDKWFRSAAKKIYSGLDANDRVHLAFGLAAIKRGEPSEINHFMDMGEDFADLYIRNNIHLLSQSRSEAVFERHLARIFNYKEKWIPPRN